MKQLETIAQKRAELLESYPDIAAQVTASRENMVANLDELLAQAEVSLAGKGTRVYYAKDVSEAQKLLQTLCQGAQGVVRIDSSELAEVQLDRLMAEQGTQVGLTDLAEIIAREARVTQGKHPLLGSALDELSQAEIVQALQKYVGSEEVDAPQALAKLAHQLIRNEIIASDYGITGINAIVAENGTIILAENEGNAREVSNLPYHHIAVAGLDKLYGSAEEALSGIQAAHIYGLGRNNATYYSLISGQSRTADIEFKMAFGMHGPLEVHLVLLDNGRRDLLQKGCGKLLQCIDCGACYQALQALAQENGWASTLLTAKNVGLLAMRGELGATQGLDHLAEFVCPVGITAQDIRQAIE